MKLIDNIISFYKKYNHMISFLLLIFLFFSPVIMSIYNCFYDNSGIDFWYKITRIVGLLSAVNGAIIFLIKLKEGIKKDAYISILSFLFVLVLGFIATMNSNNQVLSYYGHWYTKNGFEGYLLYTGFFLNAINIRKIDLKKVGYCLCAIASIISVVALLNNGITHKLFFINNDQYNGVFFHFNHFGYYLSITTIIALNLFIYEKKVVNKIIALLMYIVLALMLIKNNTFGAYLAVLVTLVFVVFYAIKNKKFYSILIGILIFISFSLFVTNNGNKVVYSNFKGLYSDAEKVSKAENAHDIRHIGTDRGMLWSNGLTFIKESPWIGYGPDNLMYKYISVGVNQGSPHNLLIQIAGYTGVPSLIFYLIAVGTILINCLLKMKTICVESMTFCFACISYLIVLMTGVTIFYTAPYFYALLGILFGQLYICDESKK